MLPLAYSLEPDLVRELSNWLFLPQTPDLVGELWLPVLKLFCPVAAAAAVDDVGTAASIPPLAQHLPFGVSCSTGAPAAGGLRESESQASLLLSVAVVVSAVCSDS